MFSLKEKEVNTGRQRELDLVKGFLMIMIVSGDSYSDKYVRFYQEIRSIYHD